MIAELLGVSGMETTFTVGAGAIGLIVGAGMGFGMVRAKLNEVEKLQRALFKKFDALANEQKQMAQTLARHDERIRMIAQGHVAIPHPREDTNPIDLR